MLTRYSDIDAALKDLDLASDRFIARLSHTIALSSDVDDTCETMLRDRLRDSMVVAHIRAAAIWSPDYSLSDSPKRPKVTKQQRDSLREFYDAVSQSSTKKGVKFVRDALKKDLERASQGKAIDAKATLRRAGVSTAKRAGHVARTLLRTQTSLAFNASAWSYAMQDERLWGFEYATARDERVRAAHRAMQGVRYPKDHEFWNHYAPPNGWNCRCGLNPVRRKSRIRAFRGVPEIDSAFLYNPGLMF